MNKKPFFAVLLVIFALCNLPRALHAQCLPNSSLPAGFVPFAGVDYISAPDAAGDRLVVGSVTASTYAGLSQIPLPDSVNQQFCSPVQLAPGISASVYVPTAAERTGTFSDFDGLLLDPSTGSAYSNGVIPSASLPTLFAWRIPAAQTGPPVYVSTFAGQQILKVDGNSGVTSVLYDTGAYVEGMAVGPDNLIYAASPISSRIIRVDQQGDPSSFSVVYDAAATTGGPDSPEGPSFGSAGNLTFNTRTEGSSSQGVWQIHFDASDNPSAPVQIISPPTSTFDGEGTTFDAADRILIVDRGDDSILRQTAPLASTTQILINNYLGTPIGVAVDSAGDIFAANSAKHAIFRFNSSGAMQNTYVSFPADDYPVYFQFDASDRLFVVTDQGAGGVGGKLWRVDPSSSSPGTGTATLLVDLGFAFNHGTVPGLAADTANGVALPPTSRTTTLQAITPGATMTFSDGNVLSQKVLIPSGSSLGGAAYMAAKFQQWAPSVFDATRLPATGTNLWSGGTPVPSGATCTAIGGAAGNCMVVQDLCFDSSLNPVFPCNVTAPAGSAIQITTSLQTQVPQTNPALIIATDGHDDWANITTKYVPPYVLAEGISINSDSALVNLPSYNVCLLYDPDKAVKSGATIPLKMYLCDAAHTLDLSGPGIAVHATGLELVGSATADTVEDSGNANPDADFRFDASLGPDGGYIFNLQTKGLAPGTYDLHFTAGTDTADHFLVFQVK